MYGYIYLIEDTTNGKKYVGQHKYKKFMLDNTYHGSGTIIKDIRKKRPETLTIDIICGCYNREELNFFENYWIEKLNTLYPNGYNLTTGGDAIEYSEESKMKMSKSNKGRKPWNKGKKNVYSEETLKIMSELKKGKSPWNKGIPMSEEQIKKCSIPILQFTLDGEFVAEYLSGTEVQRKLGFAKSNICKVLKGNRKSAYGFLWRYKI